MVARVTGAIAITDQLQSTDRRLDRATAIAQRHRMKRCPHCAEQLRDEAAVCPFCWSIVTGPVPRTHRGGRVVFVMIGVVALAVLYAAC